MNTKLIKIWCEYDIGVYDIVFTSKSKAMDWLTSDKQLQNLRETNVLNGACESIHDLIDIDLLGFTTIELIGDV